MSLSVLIVSAFLLFFINGSDILKSWKENIRIFAYLKNDVDLSQIPLVSSNILLFENVSNVKFIPKDEALIRLKKQIKESAMLDDLKENPLPNCFEVYLSISNIASWEDLENIASKIESLSEIDDVEYGQRWVQRFMNVFNLFKFSCLAIIGLLFLASVFIVANTIRLVFYSRKIEIEIMRVVGASESFIKAPFYVQGIINGTLGGILGIGILLVSYYSISSNIAEDLSLWGVNIRFIPIDIILKIILSSTLVGVLGCYLSLKQFSDDALS
ncbi:MAG: ABC transporter permease [Desulfobacterales bacterium]|nr:ABC transporter permease [Desulfobacterales bacterium]